jgi:hypothetical protein
MDLGCVTVIDLFRRALADPLIDAIDSLVEVLFSNSRNRYQCGQDFGLSVCFFRSRYQRAVGLLTASTGVTFEYPNFRLFPDLKKNASSLRLDY